MVSEYLTLYYYITKSHDGKEWYLADVDPENGVYEWTRDRSKAFKQLNEVNVIKYMHDFMPNRRDVVIKGMNELIEISYIDLLPF